MADSDTCTLQLPVPPRTPRWRLRIANRREERVRILSAGQRLTLGSGDASDVTLRDPLVSSVHCAIEAGNPGLRVLDLDSKNGLYLGSGRVRELRWSSRQGSFSLGETTVHLELLDGSSSEDDLGLVGRSQAMEAVRTKIRQFAPLRAPVMILGESGTGKDLVARALHREAGRVGAYVPLNVAALSEQLVEAELFGHVRGAFTGAVGERAGAFRQAHEGTLFLDELGELAPSIQAKLLRVVEDGMVRSLGRDQGERTDVRLVSATCAALERLIEQEKFRPDLFHRLSTLTIEVPPLRERRSDIPELVEAFLRRTEDELGPRQLSPAALAMLKRARMPGNVRQLFAAVYRAAALCRGPEVGPGDLALPGECQPPRPLHGPEIQRLVQQHGSLSAVARTLGVPRSTLRSTLDRWRHRQARAPAKS